MDAFTNSQDARESKGQTMCAVGTGQDYVYQSISRIALDLW